MELPTHARVQPHGFFEDVVQIRQFVPCFLITDQVAELASRSSIVDFLLEFSHFLRVLHEKI